MHIAGGRLPALFLVGLALAACGGGSDGVSKEDYAADLGAVCADIEQKTEEIGRTQADSAAGVSAQLDEIREAIRSGIARMRDIERPDGEGGERAREYIDKLEQTLERRVIPALEELERAIRAKDQAKIRAAAARLQAVDEGETDRLAEELGADECAEG